MLAPFEAGGERRRLCRRSGARRVGVDDQKLGWYVLKAEPVASRQDQHALDHVAQLPHVAWPGVATEQVQHRGIETRGRPGLLGCDGAEEMLGQQDRVVTMLAQRRNGKPEHGQTVIQVTAEPAGRHFLTEVAIGQRDVAAPYLPAFVAGERVDDAVLHDATQVWLEFHRHLADFIET